jgi:hypothetical protein
MRPLVSIVQDSRPAEPIRITDPAGQILYRGKTTTAAKNTADQESCSQVRGCRFVDHHRLPSAARLEASSSSIVDDFVATSSGHTTSSICIPACAWFCRRLWHIAHRSLFVDSCSRCRRGPPGTSCGTGQLPSWQRRRQPLRSGHNGASHSPCESMASCIVSESQLLVGNYPSMG